MRSCSSSVLVEEAAEQVASTYPALLILADDGERGRWPRRLQPECPMRAVTVVVLDVHSEHLLQVPLPHDQQPVEALGAHGADPPLGVGIGVGRLEGCAEDLDTLRTEDVIERTGELRI